MLVHELAEVVVILNGLRAARTPSVRATSAPGDLRRSADTVRRSDLTQFNEAI